MDKPRELEFPWSTITDAMLEEWSSRATHMSEFHMMGEAYIMISERQKPVAWLHPEANWSHVDRDEVAMHCRKDGPQPIALYR